MVGSVRPKSEPNSYPPSVAVLGSSFSQKRKPSGLSSLESYTDCIHEDEPWPSSHSASLNRREPSPPEHDQSVRLGLPDEGDATSSVFEPRRDPIVMMNRYQSSVDQGPLITSFSSNNKSQVSGLFICECCPQKPKKFGTSEELQVHETGKQYKCAYCPYRFRNKNEAERHQNSFHLHRQSWSCAALAGYESAFHRSTTDSNIADTCCYCGEDFPRTGTGPEGPGVTDQDWDIRVHHLQEVHKFGECDHAKKFYRADHFRQHLKHNHAGTTGKWTNMLENACMRDELLPNPILEPRALRTESLLNSNEVETGTTMPGAAGDLIDDTDTYTCFSKDSGYYSMVSKAQRKPANEGGDSLQWETGSIASIRSLATMDTISSVSPAAVGGAAEELAEMLVKDDLISKLIVDGYKNIGAVRFERNFRRILKNFAFGLRTEARNELEKSAIRLVHNYRAYIIILIKDRLELADGSHVTTLEELQQQKQSKLALERFLGNIAGAEDIGNADLGEGNDSGSDIDSDVSDSEQSYLPTLEKVQTLLAFIDSIL
ncbi:hypothetical protein BKA64DRAFT_260037 [Cadophora sp. MPI-SDFR-AT-0126]|nr:hypothetical protein BKA64DRAFT_260037 [Leotiomycetes sp. MPI-SDFR-AT-0126]